MQRDRAVKGRFAWRPWTCLSRFAQPEVAGFLDTARHNAHCWHTQWTRGGRELLASFGSAGRSPNWAMTNSHASREAVLDGAHADGFDQDLSTRQQVAIVIGRLTGVRHHPGHACYILRPRLGRSP